MSGRRARREALVEVYNEASVCTRCPLSRDPRTRVVFGAGNADADLMFVGEAPGAEEDRQGLPFVGRAGGLLTELLEGIGLKREDVFIANVLKCRPPGNRDPQPEEIEACRPYLERQVELIEPRVIGTLGNFATKLLTANPTGITRVRGTPQEHLIGGRIVFLLPALPSGRRAAHARGSPSSCARTSRQIPDAAGRSRCPSRSRCRERRASRSRTRWACSAAELDLFADGRATRSAAETEALGRAARGRARPGRRRARQRRAREPARPP